MPKSNKLRKIGKVALWVVCTPIVLFLILALLVYLPPVQNFIVQRVCTHFSETTGVQFSVDNVRLAFPLDLNVNGVKAVQKGDTLLNARTVRLNLEMLPLFHGQANVSGIELDVSRIDTKNYISNTRIKGVVGHLTAETKGVNWQKQDVHVQLAQLRNSDITVALADSALDDTTTTKSHWRIRVDEACLENVKARVALAGALPTTPPKKAHHTIWVAAQLKKAVLTDGDFDTGKAYYAFRSLNIKKGNVAYTPNGADGTWTPKNPIPAIPADRQLNHKDSVRIAYTYSDNVAELERWNPFPAETTARGKQWKFRTASSNSTTLQKNTKPFDPTNVVVTGLNAQIDTLSYNRAGVLRLGVRHIALQEQCGFAVKELSGAVYLDSTHIVLPALNLKTPYSSLRATINLPFSAFNKGSRTSVSLNLVATLGAPDVKNLARGYLPARYLRLYPNRTLSLNGRFSGNLAHLVFQNTSINLPGILTFKGNGRLDDITGSTPSARMNFSLRTGATLPSLFKTVLPDVAKTVSIPAAVGMKGNLSFHGSDYQLNANLATGRGNAKVKARINLQTEAFDVRVDARQLALQQFLPNMGLSAFSGTLSARSRSFDVLSPRAGLTMDARVRSFNYANYDLSGLSITVRQQGSTSNAQFSINNALLTGKGTLQATLGRDIFGRLSSNFEKIDFRRLGLTADTLQGGGQIDLTFRTNRAFTAYSASGRFTDLLAMTPNRGFTPGDIDFSLGTGNDSTHVFATSGDMVLRLGTRGNVDRLVPRLTRFFNLFEKQLAHRQLNQEVLKSELPVMDFHFEAARTNFVSDYLRIKGYQFRTAYIDLHAHPLSGLSGLIRADSITTGKLLLDSVNLAISQDTSGVVIDGSVRNYTRRNPNKFNAQLHGYVLSQGAGIQAKFFDADGDKGFDVGLRADVLQDGINIVLYPEQPVLAYRNFSINKDNYIFFGNNKQIRADVNLTADDGTGLKIYSTATDSVNDITLSVNNVNLGELSNVLPFLPKMQGMLSGDIHFFDDHKSISAMGSLQANSFAFDGTRLGQIGADVTYLPKSNGEHYASAFISSGGIEVLEAEGTYADKSGEFNVKGNLHDFPMPMLNAFLEGTDVALRGKAGGDFTLQGTAKNPILNGSLDVDSGHVYSDVYGFDFRMEEKPVAINNSKVHFENYNLYSTGKNPLVLNGDIDMSNTSKVYLDFNVKAKDFELINAQRKRNSLVFGKIYADCQGTLKGTVDNLSIRGQLNILDNTNMTYILKDSPISVDNRLEDLVKFTNFTEPEEETESEEQASSSYDLALGINVSEGAHFNCLLSEDGQNYANIEGGGNLTFRITHQGDMRLTGRLTASSGEMKYELPVIPLRTFKLVEGSTIDFTGDPTNPRLNVTALERMKVLVTENEQQRNVAFDVGVSITNTLDKMGLEFTIAAPEDLSVQNQLAAMSKEQRNKAAVAMMATGMYLTDSSSMKSGFKANNALNAFLQNEIQNIAGNALKSVDLSVGVETGTSLAGTQTTDYSFQFAKRFWDDRIRVIIGGRVSAGKNADNRAESIINNVSVEYRMNQGATRYLRVFYDRDQQDPLEGQLTKAGLGYSVRKKTDKFGDLFIFWRKKEKK